MDLMLRASESEVDKGRRRVFLLVQINATIYRRCLRLVLREITDVANGYRRVGKDGNVSD